MNTNLAVIQATGQNEAVHADYLDLFHCWAQRLLAKRHGNTFATGSLNDSMNPLGPSTYPSAEIEPGFQIPTRPAIRPTPLYIDYSYARVA